MIDRARRDEAARLMRAWLAGAIDSDELDDAWPRAPDDRAIEAIGTMAWNFWSDDRPRRLVGEEAASPDERCLLERYAAFLDTDLPYDWPESRFDRIGSIWPLVLLTLGLLWPVERRLRARARRFDAAMTAHGDPAVWPFTRVEQWPGRPLAPWRPEPATV